MRLRPAAHPRQPKLCGILLHGLNIAFSFLLLLTRTASVRRWTLWIRSVSRAVLIKW